MSRPVLRGSAGEYQADEQAGALADGFFTAEPPWKPSRQLEGCGDFNS